MGIKLRFPTNPFGVTVAAGRPDPNHIYGNIDAYLIFSSFDISCRCRLFPLPRTSTGSFEPQFPPSSIIWEHVGILWGSAVPAVPYIVSYITFSSIYYLPWNPNDPYFDWKRPCFGRLAFKDRGQLGSTDTFIPMETVSVALIVKKHFPPGNPNSGMLDVENCWA